MGKNKEIKYHDDADALCPFYRHDDRSNRIVCECCISNAERIVQHFRRKADFLAYKERFCCGEYMNCLLHWANLDGYERREKAFEQSD